MLRSPVDKIESDKRAVEAGCAQVHAVGSLVDAQVAMLDRVSWVFTVLWWR